MVEAGSNTHAARETASRLRWMMGVEPWAVDHVRVGNDSVETRGWALAPQGDPSLATFRINGKEFDQTDYPLPRADIGRIFWYTPNPQMSGFVCRAKLSRNEMFPDGHAVFSYGNKQIGRPLREDHNYYYPDPTKDRLPLPDPERRKRVHGSTDEISFRLEGYSAYAKLQLALRRVLNRHYGDFANILDWGCGCGRMTRYFRDLKHAGDVTVTGVDVDADNVRWCSRNLGFGQFLHIPLHPLTDLRDSAFDLLIGLSVFTHLNEPTQLEWLDELRRISREGAVLLMSIHAEAAICRIPRLRMEWLEALRRNGFLDAGSNRSLEGLVAELDYYRNSYHTREYVLRYWSKYFEIVDIIEGYIGNFQDLVVMRKV